MIQRETLNWVILQGPLTNVYGQGTLQGRGGGGGGLACAESGLAGWVGCCCGRPWVTERTGILSKPYACHKPYNVGRVPVLINLNLYLIL